MVMTSTVTVRARRLPSGFFNLGKLGGRQVVFREEGEERDVPFTSEVERAVDAGFVELVEKPKPKKTSKSKSSKDEGSE